MTCEVDKTERLKIVSSDSHFSQFTGMHPSKIKQGKLYLDDVVHPQDRETVRRAIFKKDAPYVYVNFCMTNKDGEDVFVHAIGTQENGGRLCRLVLADVSRSQKKSEEMKNRADEMNRLIDLVNAGVCLFRVTDDMKFEAMYMNKSCCELFGITQVMFAGRTYYLDEFIHGDDRSRVFQAIGKAMATQKPIDTEIRICKKNQEVRWCKLGASLHRYDDGSPVFHGILSDITDVKNAEQDADDERDLMVKMFKNLPGPLFTADFDAPFILDVVSSDFIKFIGYSRKEFFEDMGGDLTRLMTPKEVPVARHSLVVSAEQGGAAKATYSIRTKSGKHIIVRDRRRIVERENGERATIGILRDVTEKARNQFETLDI